MIMSIILNLIQLNFIRMDSMDMDDADEELPVNDHRDENYIPDVEDEKVDPHVEFIISVGNKVLHALPSTDTYRKALILDVSTFQSLIGTSG